MVKRDDDRVVPGAAREAAEPASTNFWDVQARTANLWITELCDLIKRVNDPKHSRIVRLQMRYRAGAAKAFIDSHRSNIGATIPVMIAVEAVANEVIRATDADYRAAQREADASVGTVTKGDWRVSGGMDPDIVAGPNGVHVAHVATRGMGHCVEPNARLLASSKAMLTALGGDPEAPYIKGLSDLRIMLSTFEAMVAQGRRQGEPRARVDALCQEVRTMLESLEGIVKYVREGK